MILKYLLGASLICLPVVFMPAYGGPIRHHNASGATDVTVWTAAGPCQGLFDSSSMPGCPGASARPGALFALVTDGSTQGGFGAHSARLFTANDTGGIFGSNIFSGWGYNGSQGDDPGSGDSYFLNHDPFLGLGQPEDQGESAPEPSSVLLMGLGLAVVAWFGRSLARRSEARRVTAGTGN